jgi:hypothetical protein
MSIPWTRTITRRRFASPTIDAAGRWSRGTWADTPIRANVQPAPGARTTTGPDGKRAPDRIVVFVPLGTLRTTQQLAGVVADRVHIPYYGSWYECDLDASHDAPGFRVRHQRMECLRVDEADQSPGTPSEPP